MFKKVTLLILAISIIMVMSTPINASETSNTAPINSSSDKIKITVLVDNNTLVPRYFQGEPALSYYISTGDKKILFDVGYSDIYIQNARKMNINLLDLDYLVLTHGHLDHTWGLASFIKLYVEAALEKFDYKKPQVIAHPLLFSSRYTAGDIEIGSMLSEEKLKKHFPVRLSKEPIWLTDKLVYLGQIERKNNFEAKTPLGKVESPAGYVNDYIEDDSALVYKSPKGLVIISGCAHSGICNMVEQAKKICGDNRIVDIIGGLHLQNPPETQLNRTLDYMKKLNPTAVHACHCTDLASKIALSRVVNIKEVGVGTVLEY